jgi:hypothetical protein
MRKLLWVLELENTFLMTKNLRNKNTVFGAVQNAEKPAVEKDGMGIYFRPGREDFLDFCFNTVLRFRLLVQQSGGCGGLEQLGQRNDPNNNESILRGTLRKVNSGLKRLLFVTGTDRAKIFGNKYERFGSVKLTRVTAVYEGTWQLSLTTSKSTTSRTRF